MKSKILINNRIVDIPLKIWYYISYYYNHERMIQMKWYRYFILTFFSLLLISLIFNFNEKVSLKNNEILKISKLSEKVKTFSIQVNDLNKFTPYMNSSYIDKRFDEISIGIKNDNDLLPFISQDYTDYLKTTVVSFEKDKLNRELPKLHSKLLLVKKNLIDSIRNLQKKRNNLFVLLILSTVLFLILEFLKIDSSNKKISRYLNNILFKQYDFDIHYSNVPYIDNTLDEIRKVRDNLKILDNSINVTLKGYSLLEVLEEIFNNSDFKKYLNFERIGFAQVEKEFIIAGISLSNAAQLKLKRGFKINISDSESLRHIIDTKEIRIINDLEKHYMSHPNSVSTRLILEEGFKSSLTAPLYKGNGKIIGILFFSSTKKNSYNEIDKYKISSLIDILSSVFEKNMLIEDLVTNSALTFVKLVEGKDPETSNHLERMAHYSRIIAKSLSKNEKYRDIIDYYYLDTLYKYAPLHDIGKVGIPDNILLKPGRLTPEEFEVMKEHTKIGARVLNFYQNNLKRYDLPVFNTAVEIAISHHEKWDGSGYPLGKKGEDIPLSGRIIAVADVFDALSSKRIYKDAFPFEKSVEIIKDMSGSHFDPEIVQSFMDSLNSIRDIYNELKEV